MSLALQIALRAPSWMYVLARHWVRTQLAIASAVVAGLVSVSVGLNPLPNNIPLESLVLHYPGPAIGLGSALMLVSALAVVLARHSATHEAAHEAARQVAGAGVSGPSSAPSGPGTPRWMLVGTVVLALISLGILAAGGALLYTSSQTLLQTTARTIEAYCSDITHADPTRADDPHYGDAWHLLSAAAQHQAEFADSQTEFEHLQHLQSLFNGSATSCQLVNGAQGMVVKNTTAVGVVRVMSRKTNFDGSYADSTFTGGFHLVFEQNTWRLDYVDQTLLGINILPLATAEDMCNDFGRGNFGNAFDRLTASAQTAIGGTVGSLAAVGLPPASQHIVLDYSPCVTKYETYIAPPPGGTTASASLTEAVRISDVSTHACVALGTFVWRFHLAEVNFVWQVSDFLSGSTRTFTDCAGHPLPAA